MGFAHFEVIVLKIIVIVPSNSLKCSQFIKPIDKLSFCLLPRTLKTTFITITNLFQSKLDFIEKKIYINVCISIVISKL